VLAACSGIAERGKIPTARIVELIFVDLSWLIEGEREIDFWEGRERAGRQKKRIWESASLGYCLPGHNRVVVRAKFMTIAAGGGVTLADKSSLGAFPLK
jgi:hypothetical protein